MTTWLPGLYSQNTLLYGVEVKFYSSKVLVDSHMETAIKGLFAAGDGAGITRGLMQAGFDRGLGDGEDGGDLFERVASR